MDGPNVLHQVHGAYRNISKAFVCGLENFLSSCCWLFKDISAQQEV